MTQTPTSKLAQFPLVLQALAALLVFFLLIRPPVDADLWWHLRAGQVMWEQKSILLEDVFSYTRAGEPWVNAFWLAELALYGLYRLGGYTALAAFVAGSGALSFWLAGQRERPTSILSSGVILLAALAAAPIWGPRPQVFSFLLVAALDSWLAAKRPAWALVPLFALWANLHGGWIWGFLLLAAHLAGLGMRWLAAAHDERLSLTAEIRPLLGWTALSTLAISLNPNGLALWKLPFAQISVSMQIQEWLSPDFHRIDFHPMLWILFLLLLSGPLTGKPDWPGLFKTIGFAYLTFVAQRNIALFALAAAPLLVSQLETAIKRFPLPQTPSIPPGRFSALINSSLLAALGLAATGFLFLQTRPAKVEQNYPLGAVQWVQENAPDGRLFNSYNWGGYLAWALPQVPLFIDGRADLYGNELLAEWQAVVNADPEAARILAKWDIGWLLLEPEWPIVALLQEKGWKTAYHDDLSIILTRPPEEAKP
jgi:hypothetical protein